MQTVFLDIDNTLIYSHRHSLDTPKRAAEFLNGNVQSYITEKTYSYLSTRRDLQIVPVTTRTLPQFMRIEALLCELGCTTSLVCNGGVLVHGGVVDGDWVNESLRLSAKERRELPPAVQWLQSRCGEDKTHFSSGLFVYAGTDDPTGVADGLRQAVDLQKVEILCDSRKVYCIPRTLNKGTALQRFMLQYGISSPIVAGDSDFDVPMLNLGEIAVIPAGLADKVCSSKRIIADGTRCFSDVICECLENLSENHGINRNGDTVWNNP